ncbi:MAG: hypothetical protein MJ094_07295 [Saccharofermentans sp.]|nr:hypothetical protein [Saccharofermentans sp.]
MCINKNEVAFYDCLNEYANKNSVVVLGSTFMHNVPMAELRQSMGIMSEFYNRSLTNLKICEAKEVIYEIMNSLSPRKILLHLGEVELNSPDTDIHSLIKEYETAIKTIDKKCKVVIISTQNDLFNKELISMCANNKYQYADITNGNINNDSLYINAFMKLKYFLTDSVTDAFSIAI